MSIKKIWLIIALCIHNQTYNAQENNELMEIENNEFTYKDMANYLISKCFVTPEMQYFIWKASVNKNSNFTINVLCGQMQTTFNNTDIISYDIIIESTVDDKIKEKALHAFLEAIRIAKFKAALDAAYNHSQPIYSLLHTLAQLI